MTPLFTTTEGVIVPSVTEAEMREVDRIAIEETGPNLFQMMENAGGNLALTALDLLDSQSSGPIVIAAGTGGNGGGGINAGRHLANRGVDVRLIVTDLDRLGDVPEFQLHVFRAAGGRIVDLSVADEIDPALVIDAVIGYSLRGAPSGRSLELIQRVNAWSAEVLALDMPSGVDATTGATPGKFVRADTTMTLALPKVGLGNEAAGSLVLADIGIPIETYRRAGIDLPESAFGSAFRVPLRR